MSKRYIAVVSEKGAGKGLFAEIVKKLLPNHRIGYVRYSHIVREILTILGKDISRENMQILATSLRDGFKDEGIFNSAIKQRMQNLDADIIILDGLRKPAEVPPIKKLGGILVYIAADQRIRFERRKTDVENVDERDINWEEFIRQDLASTEVYIREVGEKVADYKIENNGTIQEFEQKIKEFLEKFNVG